VPRLFRSYQQASASVARLHGGTGLGLTIVRELADLMRGNAPSGSGVGVYSVFGQGSCFWFEIELLVPPASDDSDHSLHMVGSGSSSGMGGAHMRATHFAHSAAAAAGVGRLALMVSGRSPWREEVGAGERCVHQPARPPPLHPCAGSHGRVARRWCRHGHHRERR
jgi:hypothetical protein